MPIKIPTGLPAGDILHSENIFVMDENRAMQQDIRPLKLAILNLMPTKITTEVAPPKRICDASTAFSYSSRE